jgi:hypothetical protein
MKTITVPLWAALHVARSKKRRFRGGNGGVYRTQKRIKPKGRHIIGGIGIKSQYIAGLGT